MPVWVTAFVVGQFLFNLGILWVILFHVNSHYSGVGRSTKKHRM